MEEKLGVTMRSCLWAFDTQIMEKMLLFQVMKYASG